MKVKSFFAATTLAVFTAAGTVCAQTSGTVNVQTAALQFNLEHRTVKLNSGYEMPVLGIGTYRISQQQAENSVYWALKAGMRLTDTARIYGSIEERYKKWHNKRMLH